jgi:hypothetical protein
MYEIKVWDGTTPNRSNLMDVKSPDFKDYLIIVRQIQQLQTAFNNATGNLALLPSVKNLFADIQCQIDEFQRQINNLILPDDVKDSIVDLSARIDDQDTRKDVNILKRDIEILKVQLDQNQLQVLKLQKAFASDVTAFQSKVWTNLRTLEKEIKERLDRVEKKLENVSIQTRIQSLLDELTTKKE